MMQLNRISALLRLRRVVAVGAVFLTIAVVGYAPADRPDPRAAGDAVVLAASPSDVSRPGPASAEEALVALAPYVKRTSDPAALRTALQAYFNYREAYPDVVAKPY